MPVLSFNPAYPQRRYATIPEQRRAGLPVRVPGGVGGPIALPSGAGRKRDTRVGGIVPGGPAGGVAQQPRPNIDRSSPLMIAMQNPFRGGLATLNMTFRNLQFLNNDAANRYNTGGTGSVNWTTNTQSPHIEKSGPLDPRASWMAISRGVMKSDTALYETKRFMMVGLSEAATPKRSNQLGRTISQPQQTSGITNFLTRWVSTSTQANQTKTLPVIPYAAVATR